MADVKVELEEIKELSELDRPVGALKPKRNLVWVVLAAMFLVSIAGVGFVILRHSSTPARTAVAVPLTSYPGMEEVDPSRRMQVNLLSPGTETSRTTRILMFAS
jgi:hypothetical protein